MGVGDHLGVRFPNDGNAKKPPGPESRSADHRLPPRFFRSLKQEWLQRIQVPLGREAMRREVATYLRWHEEHRPHQGLAGRTPKEVYDGESSETTGDASTDRRRPLALVV